MSDSNHLRSQIEALVRYNRNESDDFPEMTQALFQYISSQLFSLHPRTASECIRRSQKKWFDDVFISVCLDSDQGVIVEALFSHYSLDEMDRFLNDSNFSFSLQACKEYEAYYPLQNKTSFLQYCCLNLDDDYLHEYAERLLVLNADLFLKLFQYYTDNDSRKILVAVSLKNYDYISEKAVYALLQSNKSDWFSLHPLIVNLCKMNGTEEVLKQLWLMFSKKQFSSLFATRLSLDHPYKLRKAVKQPALFLKYLLAHEWDDEGSAVLICQILPFCKHEKPRLLIQKYIKDVISDPLYTLHKSLFEQLTYLAHNYDSLDDFYVIANTTASYPLESLFEWLFTADIKAEHVLYFYALFNTEDSNSSFVFLQRYVDKFGFDALMKDCSELGSRQRVSIARFVCQRSALPGAADFYIRLLSYTNWNPNYLSQYCVFLAENDLFDACKQYYNQCSVRARECIIVLDPYSKEQLLFMLNQESEPALQKMILSRLELLDDFDAYTDLPTERLLSYA